MAAGNHRPSTAVTWPVPCVLAAALLAIGSSPVRADVIVNISGTRSGEQIPVIGPNQQGPLTAPVQYQFGAGSYAITDAWNPGTGVAPGALYDAWNFEAGNPNAWVWHWKLFTDDGSQGSTINPSNYAAYLLLDVDPTSAFSSETAAATFGVPTVIANLVLQAATTLDFVVDDHYLEDNAGGVSLDIACIAGGCLTASAVPEPSSLVLLLAGLFGMQVGALGRRRVSRDMAR